MTTLETEALTGRLTHLEDQIALLQEQLQQHRIENRAAFCLMSGDMERALAALTLAHISAAMGMQVSVFFAFWGVQAIKRTTVFQGKPAVDKLVSTMLKSDIGGLGSSKFNFGGLGPAMFERIMRSKNIATPGELLASAGDAGIRLQACAMSMDVFGITPDELLPEVTCCGAAEYIEAASRSRIAMVL